MQKKFYISDWHYGHNNCLAFDDRPFTSLEEMNQALIDRWNSVVSPGDIVYVLGDMFWCKESEAIPVLDSLAGEKFLIKGNHDRVDSEQFKKRFVKIDEYMEIVDRDRHIVLCHYPIPCFKNHYYGWRHLYGHVHNSFEYTRFLLTLCTTRTASSRMRSSHVGQAHTISSGLTPTSLLATILAS